MLRTKVILISHLTKENGGNCRFYVYYGPVFVILRTTFTQKPYILTFKDNIYVSIALPFTVHTHYLM